MGEESQSELIHSVREGSLHSKIRELIDFGRADEMRWESWEGHHVQDPKLTVESMTVPAYQENNTFSHSFSKRLLYNQVPEIIGIHPKWTEDEVNGIWDSPKPRPNPPPYPPVKRITLLVTLLVKDYSTIKFLESLDGAHARWKEGELNGIDDSPYPPPYPPIPWPNPPPYPPVKRTTLYALLLLQLSSGNHWGSSGMNRRRA